MKYLLLALALAVSSTVALAADDPIVARFGTTEIRASQIKPYLGSLSEADRQALTADPALLSRAVRTLVLQQALFKEAAAAGWEKNPDVAKELERLRQSAIAEGYLQSVAKVPDSFPSEADLKAVYDARKDQLLVPKQFEVSQIFIAVPKDADKATADAAKAKIDDAAKKAKSGDFAAVAREMSEERESASRGGSVGWLTEASLQPAIRSKVTSLAKGAVSDPVRLDDGWYVIKVGDIKEPYTATLDEVRANLTALLRREREAANREAYIARIQQQNPVTLDEINLPKLLEQKAP